MNVKPTRIELIQIKRRIRLAKNGYKLLKMKRSALIMEFMNLAREIKGIKEDLRSKMGVAIEYAKSAEINEGRMKIENYSMMAGSSTVSVSSKNIMGVKIPKLDIEMERAVLNERFRAISVPASINDAMEKFEDVFTILIKVVEKEKAMRRLLNEIDRTKRRSNAIEFVMIPRLEQQQKYIRMRLDEMERDSFTTLKTVKKKIISREEKGESI
ncbi:V-type ATP synthase subunit D [Caldiplasma sukawensis]